MNWIHRSILGVIIGIINIFFYIILSTVFSKRLKVPKDYDVNWDRKFFEPLIYSLTILLAISLSMIVFSALLIAGIVKRHHVLMMPWFVSSGLIFLYDTLRIIIMLVISIVKGVAGSLIMCNFGINGVFCGIQALFIWIIYKLWREIRVENLG